MLSLLLAVLLLAAPLYAAAADGGVGSQAPAGTVPDPEGPASSGPADLDPPEGIPEAPPSSIEGEGPAPSEAPSPTPEAPEGEESPSPDPDAVAGDKTDAPEDGDEGDEEEEPTGPAEPLLNLGGHDTYLSGNTGARFRPNDSMTRAEVASMLYRLLADPVDVSESAFTDVPFSQWYGKAVNTLNAMGIMKGDGSGRFRPDSTITRGEFVTALYGCFPYFQGEDVEFSDVDESHWAYKFIAAAVSKKWISGYTDGTFGPDKAIQRCEAVRIMNSALERRDGDFAKDREKQKFRDVPKDHWAYLEVAEAAKPVDTYDPEEENRPIKPGQTVRVTADSGLNMRDAPSTSANIITTLITGTVLTVVDTVNWPWIQVRTSGGSQGYVHSDYVALYNGGDGNGTGSGASLSASSLTLHQYQTVRLDASVTSGMNAMRWTSSDPSVAEVSYMVPYSNTKHGAMVYGKKPGTATLTFADSGTTRASCTITVTEAEPVRFAYSDVNIVGKGDSFNLLAITDTSRSAVRFRIVDGPATGTYETADYVTKTQKSTHGLADNTVRVFSRTVSFGMAGVYTLRAYSQDASGYSTGYAEFTVQVTNGNTASVSSDSRRASGEIIKIIAQFEGFVPEIEDDQLARGNPTVGHGYVVPVNNTFYNNVTREEALGNLIDKVNQGAFAKAVEDFRASYNIRMNQGQFDALTSFAYNLGPHILDPDEYYTFAIMLNAVVPPSDMSASNPYTGTLNAGSGSIYSSTSVSSSRLTTVPGGASVQVTGYERKADSTHQEVWYKVSYGSTSGWMPAGYVRLNANLTRDLSYADSTVLAYNLLLWHTASGTHYVGLLRRRLAECKLFFFSNYDEAYQSNANYTKNTYGFIFPSCCR